MFIESTTTSTRQIKCLLHGCCVQQFQLSFVNLRLQSHKPHLNDHSFFAHLHHLINSSNPLPTVCWKQTSKKRSSHLNTNLHPYTPSHLPSTHNHDQSTWFNQWLRQWMLPSQRVFSRSQWRRLCSRQSLLGSRRKPSLQGTDSS